MTFHNPMENRAVVKKPARASFLKLSIVFVQRQSKTARPYRRRSF